MAKTNEERAYQSPTSMNLAGHVTELEFKKDEKDGIEYVSGEMTIKYGDTNEKMVTLDIYQPAVFKKSGKENRNYSTTIKALEEIVTVGQATEETKPSIVRISNSDPSFAPSVAPNKYYSVKNEEFGENLKAQLGMFTSPVINNNIKEEDFCGQFSMDITVISVEHPEVDGEIDDTVLLVKGGLVDYDGKFLTCDFIVRDEEIIEGLLDMETMEGNPDKLAGLLEEFDGEPIPCEDIAQLEIWGDISLTNIEKTETVKSGLGGKGKQQTTKIFNSELVIEGGNPLKADKIPLAEVMTAIDKIEEHEAEIKQSAIERAEKKNSASTKTGKGGFSSNRTKSTKTSTRKKF